MQAPTLKIFVFETITFGGEVKSLPEALAKSPVLHEVFDVINLMFEGVVNILSRPPTLINQFNIIKLAS